jgi:hypothetical protein
MNEKWHERVAAEKKELFVPKGHIRCGRSSARLREKWTTFVHPSNENIFLCALEKKIIFSKKQNDHLIWHGRKGVVVIARSTRVSSSPEAPTTAPVESRLFLAGSSRSHRRGLRRRM